MFALDVFGCNTGIYHRCRDVCVSKQFTDVFNWHTIIKCDGSCCMPQCVWGHVFRNLGCPISNLFYHSLQSSLVHLIIRLFSGDEECFILISSCLQIFFEKYFCFGIDVTRPTVSLLILDVTTTTGAFSACVGYSMQSSVSHRRESKTFEKEKKDTKA